MKKEKNVILSRVNFGRTLIIFNVKNRNKMCLNFTLNLEI